ncbi:MAG: hypothetical protein MI861_03750 [Pirellulales bacterium]|nr:hypothetical protein [Pirellulales bacterium]
MKTLFVDLSQTASEQLQQLEEALADAGQATDHQAPATQQTMARQQAMARQQTMATRRAKSTRRAA